jgi:hypothetical protein
LQGMLQTCRQHVGPTQQCWLIFPERACRRDTRHAKSPNTQFIPIKADKFKSAQTYEYPSYHRVFDKTTNMSSNVATCRQMLCHLDTLADMQCRRVVDMTEDVSATCRDTTQHVCKWRLGKTWQIETFTAKLAACIKLFLLAEVNSFLRADIKALSHGVR